MQQQEAPRDRPRFNKDKVVSARALALSLKWKGAVLMNYLK